ncbi:MAG: class A beta-lactamase-related serine hydrolase, partial [Chloroflexota bacterium]|nr:class A beta-lactamase-related serine hydrolase [Chloroflexota bacterium]
MNDREPSEMTVEQGWERVDAITRATAPGGRIAAAARLVGGSHDGPVWAIDANETFPAASTIKTAILVALYREVDVGRLDLGEVRRVDAAAKTPGSGVLGWLRDDLPLTLADLASLMIAVSDNTASNLLLDAVGIDRVQATIAELGLTATALNRRFLGRAPGPGEPDNTTSAADLVSLLVAIAEGTAASPASCERMWETLRLQQHRDRLARHLPPEIVFGGKSGSLPGLAHDSGLIEG